MGMLMSSMGGTGSGFGLATQATSIITGALYDRFLHKPIENFESFHEAILDIFNNINMALPGNHYDAPTHTRIEDFFKEWNDENKKKFIEFMNKNVNLSNADESTHTEIEKFYEEWKSKDDNEKKKNFIDFKDSIKFKEPTIVMKVKSIAGESTHTEIEEKLYEEWKSKVDDEYKKKFIEFMSENVNLSKADASMMITGILAPPAAMVAKKTGQSLPQLSVIKSIPDVAFVPTATILLLIGVKLTKKMSFKNLPS